MECTGQGECQPYKSLKSVLSWKPDPADWSGKVLPLISRSVYCYKGKSLECDYKCRKPAKLLTSAVPKTLVCHDMRGGYLDDRFVEGACYENQYLFYSWPLIDKFIYFSHNLVTIPPLMWINAAHKNGVEILGTLITEHTEGTEIWDKVLNDDNVMSTFVDKLNLLCRHFKFDGYLVNIENSIDPQLLSHLTLFLKNLKNRLGPDRKVIWYDAVSLLNGELGWQNELNEHNRAAFQICDGIFLNYCWSEQNLKKSAINAGSRQLDVYIGVDVFGRGCVGGGGFNCDVALNIIEPLGLSIALFATGWTHEYTHPQDCNEFLRTERKFWNKVLPYLYVRLPNKVPFETNFNQGITSAITDAHSKLWYDLSSQSYQVDALLYSDSNSLVPQNLWGNTCVSLSKSAYEVDDHRMLLCDFWCSVENPLRIMVRARANDSGMTAFNLIVAVEGSEPCSLNYDVILKFSEEVETVLDSHELVDYSCCLSSSNEINKTKTVKILDKGWVENAFMMNFNGKITEVKVKTEKPICIKLLRLDFGE